MSRPQLRQWDDPILKEQCMPVTKEDLPGLRRLISDMEYAMKRGAQFTRGDTRWQSNGVGLAAPQIGVLLRVIMIRPAPNRAPLVMINPEIVKWGDREVDGVEGCLSYPGFETTIKRYDRVEVSFLPGDGTPRRVQSCLGFPARIVQHEIDHLNGICLVGDAWREQQTAQGHARAMTRDDSVAQAIAANVMLDDAVTGPGYDVAKAEATANAIIQNTLRMMEGAQAS